MTTSSSPLNNLSTTQLLSTIPSGLFLVDLEMRIVYWNVAAERITGFTAAEAVGQHCSFLQGIPCGKRCGLYDAEIAKPVIGAQCTILGKDGRPVHLLKNLDFLRDGNGAVIGGIESFVDITRQRILETDLREQAADLERRVAGRTEELALSEGRLRAVLDTMDDLAYCADSSYRLTMMNRAMRDLYGNWEGGSCYQVLHGSDHPCAWCEMPRVLAGETLREEREMGSGRRTYEIIHSPLAGRDGVTQKLAVCRDISERKQAERQLLETNRELDAFAHSISHDLRGVLAPIVTYMDFLRLQFGDSLDPQVLQLLAEVERQGERAITLLDDLLDLARVGRIDGTGASVDVAGLVAEVVRERTTGEGGSRPELLIGALPPLAIPESLVYQLFANLVGNALRYAGPGGGPVEVGYREEATQGVYYVRDHGPGVPPEEREKVFEIFHRGVSAGNTRGTGIGLAIVRKIARRYEGEAWVEETPGGGATFCFALPLPGR